MTQVHDQIAHSILFIHHDLFCSTKQYLFFELKKKEICKEKETSAFYCALVFQALKHSRCQLFLVIALIAFSVGGSTPERETPFF